MTSRPLQIALVVGEHSGDQLGFKLMQALRALSDQPIVFRGTAGPAMTREGMTSLFPLDDIAVMGIAAVLARFRTLYARGWQVIDAVVADPPDALVIIDSPDFTHAVARRVRRRLPDLPIIDYVSPSVWAWRPGRARAMRAYVDHVLALLPFEPAAYERLQGPPCSYVGHPLMERLDELRPDAREAALRDGARPQLLVLPGSRTSEVTRLTDIFGKTLMRLASLIGPFDAVLPTVPRHAERLRQATAGWEQRPQIVTDEADKFAAFRRARGALAASGTVTLELALAQVPMIGAYRFPGWEAFLAKRLVKAPFFLLPNLILGREAVPELFQEEVTPDNLAASLAPLLGDTPARAAQLAAFAEIDRLMRVPGETPSQRAAGIVLETIAAKRKARG
ncbi:lipid-A-disaccharide synthase [Labrys monachus]|uniref:Lipid-A-disaccharide synthase n=1 Tax=Labrys monachus TaxID=217067 RepID=A0ABU0FF20_9HYPH|nr:lipid-A-disaccharide synthase [Labrys monachus]MDQ0393218.1 lipid-A-disaccharide synthase [Labrys monachus]